MTFALKHWHTFTRGSGLLIAPILGVADLVLLLRDISTLGVLVVGIFAAFLFCLSAFGMILTQGDQLTSLRARIRLFEDHSPRGEVSVLNEPEGMFLDVVNVGARGTFEAQVEIEQGEECITGPLRPTLPIYAGYWERAAGPRAQILQGHSDRLMIGSVNLGSTIAVSRLSLYFYDVRSQELAAYWSTSWIPTDDRAVRPNFVLKITISATPRPRDRSFHRSLSGRRRQGTSAVGTSIASVSPLLVNAATARM